jgi:anti-anti-sigma factor
LRPVCAELSTAVKISKANMLVKIDTKEKFHVITLNSTNIAANMTAEIKESMYPLLQTAVKNVVFNLKNIESVEPAAAESLVNLQQYFYENNASLVYCELQKPVEDSLEREELLELINHTPTESEAWDIVQMEEIERELLGDEE